jgi:multicomponent Na+:H+ antiporter subunit C
MSTVFSLFNYWVVIILMMVGFFIVIAHQNLIKKLVGLNIFQTSVFILFITMGKVDGGTTPILNDNYSLYSNPLPHVLILTAIVVGVATTALGLALAIRIHTAYHSLNEREIHQQDEP